MQPTLLQAFSACALSIIVAAIGLLLARTSERWSKQFIPHISAFSAGLLLCISLLHLVPHAISLPLAHQPATLLAALLPTALMHTMIYVVVGYALFFVLEGFLQRLSPDCLPCHHAQHHHWHADDCPPEAPEHDATDAHEHYAHHHTTTPITMPTDPPPIMPWVVLVAIGIHAATDGMVYGITFHHSATTGWASALGLILHKWPEAILAYFLMRSAGFRKLRSFWTAWLNTGLMTLVGLLLLLPWLITLQESQLLPGFALSAGGLLYLGASHLIVDILRVDDSKPQIAPFLCGLVLGIVLLTQLG